MLSQVNDSQHTLRKAHTARSGSSLQCPVNELYYFQDVETYFSEGVQKWREMHCTAHYDIFLSEVSGLVHTFPQLVYHQDTIVQSLQNHLLVPNSTALEPLLDLVVQLVRDLQKDFYPHFHRFFFITTGLLDARDPDQLEWVFTCLSYLFKFLWRLLIKDIHSVYSMYSPLLEHKKEHIRHFAAESFSFLMRKVLLFDCFMLSSSCFGMLFIGFISSGTL
uniref:Uncharacterized protein n=1 Tax=Eptatretus burgeri TaxID=7764 RepID=A0A8C4N0E1_EPTBU